MLPIAIVIVIAIIAIATVDVVFFVRSILVEPGAHFAERDEEPDARIERVVMPLGLEGRSGQIGRDDVQVDVSFFYFYFSFPFFFANRHHRHIHHHTTIIFLFYYHFGSGARAKKERKRERDRGGFFFVRCEKRGSMCVDRFGGNMTYSIEGTA